MTSLQQQRRTWRLATVALVAMAVLSVAYPLASSAGGGTFTDVGGSHPFADEIEQVATAGVANGFPDGTYRPSQPVTRQAMAAFLSRTGGSITEVDGFSPSVSQSSFENLASVPVDLGGDPDATQYVHVQGTIRFDSSGPLAECQPTCIVAAHIFHSPASQAGPTHYRTITNHQDGDNIRWEALTVDAVFAIPAGGFQAFLLRARTVSGSFQLPLDSEVTATVIPFSANP
jgi:hypothetical protein